MAKATIKSKTGAMITIEGTEKEVSNILSNFERTSIVSQAKKSISRSQAEKKQEKKHRAVSDLIIELKEEGFFDKPKNLIEVVHVLEERGRITPITSLSGLMIGFVQKKIFSRKKRF